jgi:hypothetical protein
MLFRRLGGPSSVAPLLVALSLCAAGAAESQPQRSTRSQPLRECSFRVTGHRLVQAVENGERRWEVDPGFSICILTVEVTKPVGHLELHTSDFVLAYQRGGQGDRSRCNAVRFLGSSERAEEPEWGLPPSLGGFLMFRSERLDECTRASIELAFALEDEVTQIELCVTKPAAPPLSIPRAGASGNGTPASDRGKPRRPSEVPSTA